MFNKIRFILPIALFPLVTLAAPELNLYQKAEQLFQTATIPSAQDFSSGWFSGRCYTKRSPEQEKSGALILAKYTDYSGTEVIKQVLPPAGITDQADLFDQVDDNEYSFYGGDHFEKSNPPVAMNNGSAVSDLYYEVIVGTIHTRKLNDQFVLAFTKPGQLPAADGESTFYCVMSNKKVHEL